MTKIYKRETQKPSRRKVKKKKNEHNRLRNIIVNFRVSPKEKAVIDARFEVSGMKREEFLRQSCMYQKILVKGNIRSFDRIRSSVEDIASTLKVDSSYENLTEEQTEKLKTILEMLDYLYKQNQEKT